MRSHHFSRSNKLRLHSRACYHSHRSFFKVKMLQLSENVVNRQKLFGNIEMCNVNKAYRILELVSSHLAYFLSSPLGVFSVLPNRFAFAAAALSPSLAKV